MSQNSKFFQKDEEDSQEEQETQPKSKFFQQADSEEEESQPKSKFFQNNDSDEEEDAKPAKSKFFANNDDDEPSDPEYDDKEKDDKKKSKFFGGDDSEEEEPATKSKFFAGGDDSEEEEDDKAKASSKFFAGTKEEELPKSKKGKKDKEKPKDEDDIDIDAIDFDGPKKKSKNQKKKEKLKAKKEGGGEGGEAKPEEKKETKKPEEKKPEKPKADEKKVKIEEPKPEETKAEPKKDEGKKDAKKGKKPSAAALKIAELQKKKREEEEAEKARIAEIERQLKEQQEREEAEERARKEAEEKRKQEREAKKQKMIAEGTYKTKKEREREIFAQQAREQFLQSGMVKAAEGEEKKGSKVVASKKRRPQNKPGDATATQTTTATEDTKKTEEPKVETQKATEEKPKQKEPEDVEEDWMALASDKKEPEVEVKAETKQDAPKEKAEEKVSKKDAKKEEEKVETTEQAKTDKKSKKDKADKSAKEEKKSHDKKKGKTATETEESKDEPVLRSPICCIMGHVDTGKTKLLDRMRNTNVQEGEAGGITQQIGATFFPREKLEAEVEKITSHYNMKLNVPGLLVIDTPGHESFSNLRSRGSGLCDIVILVIDIMHGIQRQTLEAIELVKMRKTPYVIALNKIDRLYGWKAETGASSYVSLKKQSRDVKLEFEDRVRKIITSLNEKGLNVALYYDNPNVDEYASIIPTSAHTGEGIPDLLGVVIRLTQRWLKKKIELKDEFKCSVLEVKVIEGLGATIDCLLVNGKLREGDRIALNTFKGPISTTIRALLTPHPMKEMRVKGEYIHHKEIQAAMGIKICADDLSEAVAGSDMYRVEKESDLDHYMTILKDEIKEIKNRINTTNEGVCVAASTLGSLEALLTFLKQSKIPVSSICIGPVSKEEVLKAMKPLLTEDKKVKKE